MSEAGICFVVFPSITSIASASTTVIEDVDFAEPSNKLSSAAVDVTATAAELNYCDGVSSNIQTQLDTKTTKGFAIASAIVFG